MNQKGICEVCGNYSEIIPTIYAVSGRVALRCCECLNQPGDFSIKTEAHN
ncbi:MAG: hypothetical protein WC325_09470 [Candidatus Bathyarchaeia archaeon]|jgi:hypothetical protein